MFRYLSLFLILTTISGCAVVTSRKLHLTQPRADATAAYYFLPKAKIHIQVLKSKDKDKDTSKYMYALKYVETSIVPDESEFLMLDYRQSALSEDNLKIKITDGLLMKVDTTTEDKSGGVIIKLAEISKEVAKAAIYPLSVGESPQVIRDLEFSLSDLSQVNSELYKIEAGKLRIDLISMASLSQSNKDGNDRSSCGVCFRPQIPYKLTFLEGETVVEQRILLLPDGAPKICMPIERSAFVKKLTNLTFEKGILTDVQIDKPSEVLGFIEIPLSIAKMIASLPTELIQLKINYSGKEKELANARKAELEAKQTLLEYLKKLKDNSNTPLD